MLLHRPPAGQHLQQRPGRERLGPVRRDRPAPSAPPRTRRRSSSRRRPGTPPARCRPRRGGRRSPRRRPRAGSPRGWRSRGTWRSRSRTRCSARGRSARSGRRGCPACSRCSARTARAGASQASTDGRNDGAAASRAAASSTASTGASASRAPRLAASIAPGPPPVATTRRLPEAVPEPGGLGVRRLTALRGVPAHHADQAPLRDPGRQGVVDRVVVQGLGQHVVLAAPLLRPRVGAGVEGAVVRLGVVQLVGGVQARPVRVDRDVGQRRQHQPARRLDLLGLTRARTCSRGTSCRRDAGSSSASTRSVRSRPWTRQPASRVAPLASRRVEVVEGVDVDDAPSGLPHGRNLLRRRAPSAPRTAPARRRPCRAT